MDTAAAASAATPLEDALHVTGTQQPPEDGLFAPHVLSRNSDSKSGDLSDLTMGGPGQTPETT